MSQHNLDSKRRVRPTRARKTPQHHLLESWFGDDPGRPVRAPVARPNSRLAWTRRWAVALALCLLVSGCAAPIQARRADPRTVHRELTSYVLSTGELSNPTQIVLNRWNLMDAFWQEPATALAELRRAVASGQGGADEIFALAEASFLHADQSGDRAYYLASALYAYAFLFPNGADRPPAPFDPRLRDAANLYNRGLTAGFTPPDSDEVTLAAGVYRLPFGELNVIFDPTRLQWGDRRLEHFTPVAELEISGLRNRYRQPGVGAPLAAGTAPLHPGQPSDRFVAKEVQVPVTALLRLPDPRRQLANERLYASLEVYPATTANRVQVEGQNAPLEAEPTAALAYQLSRSKIWDFEFKGFLLGDLLDKPSATQLAALEPYRPGRFPVVFVHGTASSPARWAQMLNDLSNDPRIGDRFQFWFFTYNTGNPIPYSALRLRETLQEALQRLDPGGKDPALRQMVIIGHSQGGLLTKMTAIDSGDRLWSVISRKPIDQIDLRPQTRDLLQRGLFLKPLPFVRRVIFISTPHRGSYIAGNRIAHWVASLVKLPLTLATTTAELLTNPDILKTGEMKIGSVYGMTPGSPFIKALSSIPPAPGVAVHSIVAVKGAGPPEQDDDGVVEYASAHLDKADSELVVRSDHSAQGNPTAIEEVRRILRLHADEACQTAGVGCPATAAGAPTTGLAAPARPDSAGAITTGGQRR